MNDAHGASGGFRQVRREMRPPLAGAYALAGAAPAETGSPDRRLLIRESDDGPGFGVLADGSGTGWPALAQPAVRHGGRRERGRSSLGGAPESLPRPQVEAEAAWGVADAGCSV